MVTTITQDGWLIEPDPDYHQMAHEVALQYVSKFERIKPTDYAQEYIKVYRETMEGLSNE